MRIIRLDAARWHSALDFYDELLAALGAPEWHGRSVDALMIWGGINSVEPPYTIRIINAASSPEDAMQQIKWLQEALPERRAEFQRQHGSEVNVELEIHA